MATNNVINQIGVLPSFMYVSNADQTNVTGDGTAYAVTFANKIYDTTNSFDGTSTFTAPLTGTYRFWVNITLTGLTTSMTNNPCYFTVGATTYQPYQFSCAPSQFTAGGIYILNAGVIVPMTATNTITFTIRFIGGTKVVSVLGATAAGYRTPVFAGYMISGV